MTDSLKAATQRLKGLTEGDLTKEAAIVNSGDELEILTTALSKTIHSLKEYITNIRYVL